jgi:hypothetical protein
VSGRHRVQRSPRRARLVRVSVRPVCRSARAAWTPAAEAWAWVLAWAKARFERRDPFADVPLAAPQETAPDPIPVLTAPVAEPEPPTQGPLEPADALHALHDQHPELPGDLLNWRLYDGAVTGEVRALDVDETRQREIVADYAKVFASEVSEHPDRDHLSVVAHTDFAGVRFVVAAILIDGDTMPLPAYREAASTLDTQQIPDEVLAEVVGAR